MFGGVPGYEVSGVWMFSSLLLRFGAWVVLECTHNKFRLVMGFGALIKEAVELKALGGTHL